MRTATDWTGARPDAARAAAGLIIAFLMAWSWPVARGAEPILEAGFGKGTEGFAFSGDVDRVEGARGADVGRAGGGLQIRIPPAGAPSDSPLEGAWSTTVSLAEPALVRIEVGYRLRTEGGFPPSQTLSALLDVDGRALGCNDHGSLVRVQPSIVGEGRADTGWRDATLETYLPSGSHVLRLALRADRGMPAASSSEMTVDRLAVRAAGSVSFTKDGGLVLRVGGRDFTTCSWFSRPGGGWHVLGSGTPHPGEVAPWEVREERRTERTWEGTAQTDTFRLRRSVRVLGHRIEVEDTLTNLSDTDLGWVVRQELAVPDAPADVPVHLGGDARTEPSPIYATVVREGDRPVGIDCWRPANPTVFVPFPDGGVGLVMEDDVSRAHGLTYSRRAASGDLAVGFRDEQLALAPGAEHTLRWAAYLLPGPGKGYYDFINRVRSDWGVNDIRIEGPTVWSLFLPAVRQAPDEEVAVRLRDSGAWAVTTSLNGWIAEGVTPAAGEKRTIGFGPGVLDDYYAPQRQTWARDADRIHRVAPGVNVLHYYHAFLYGPERDPESYRDSWLIRRDGTRAVTDWGDLNLAPSGQMYPTPTNAMGQGMMEVLETMGGPMSGDGVYMDEVNYPTGIGWMGLPPCTYGEWDGRSAVLDPDTFAIVQKSGYLTLLSADFKKTLFERIAADGGVILGNGQPETMWENRLKFPRHTECRTDPYPRAYESHLYTPIALVEDRSFAHKRHMLEYGVIDAFVRLDGRNPGEEDLIARCYPLTVREIHAGWIRGEERIITMVSGSYSWDESVNADIHHYGSDGLLTSSREVVSASGTIDIEVAAGGVAVVERRLNDAAKRQR